MSEKKCPECKMTLDDIMDSGVVGCSNCYNVFDEELQEIIQKMQKDIKNSSLRAKKLKFSDISEFQRDRVMRLKLELPDATNKHDYIRAGEIDKMLRGIFGGEDVG